MINCFLQTREQINNCTRWLQSKYYTTHPISCKDWELANVLQLIEDGDLIDLGADGSFLLHNAIKKGINGKKIGVDLLEVTGINRAEGAEYIQGDIQATPFEDNSFDTVISLSVIEHDVKFLAFAKEVSRLLRSGGNLYISFDYSPIPVDTSLTKLYSLDWNILIPEDVVRLVSVCGENDLELTTPIDWTVQDMVITPQYCSPAQGVSYTFGLLNFIKK